MKNLSPLIMIAAAIGMFFLLAKPHYENMNIVRAEIEKYDDAIDRATGLADKRDELIDRRGSFSPADSARLQKFLPDNVNDIRLIIDVNNLALKYGSGIKDIKISQPTAAKENKAVVESDGRAYGAMEMGFTVSMPYETFLSFLGDIEKSLRLIDITTVSLKPAKDSMTYDYSVGLATYWLK